MVKWWGRNLLYGFGLYILANKKQICCDFWHNLNDERQKYL